MKKDWKLLALSGALVGLLVACGAPGDPEDFSGTDAPATTTADLPTTSDGEWADSIAEGIPCGQMLDCLASCNEEQSCLDECYLAADPQARTLVDTLDACWAANGCQDRACLETSCPQELEACETHVPEGGVVCFASGVYEVCSGGSCTRYSSTGAGWGSTVAHGEFWGSFYCSMAMNESIGIATFLNQYAGMVEPCAPTRCEANGG